MVVTFLITAVSPRLEFKAVFGLGAIIIDRILCQQSYLLLLQELDLFTCCLELFEWVFAAEVLLDKYFQAILNLRFLRDCNIAANARSTYEDHKCHLQHLFVIKQETHVRQSSRIARHRLRIAQIYRWVLKQTRRFQVLLSVHLDVVDLEACIGAVELVFGATSTLQLVHTLARKRRASDSLKLWVLLFGRQQFLLLFFEKEWAMVKTLNEVRLAKLLPLRNFISLVKFELI